MSWNQATPGLGLIQPAALQGKEVIIANRGEPVARLVPAQEAAAPPQRDLARWLNEHPLPVHTPRSAQDIDAAIAAEREAWD